MWTRKREGDGRGGDWHTEHKHVGFSGEFAVLKRLWCTSVGEHASDRELALRRTVWQHFAKRRERRAINHCKFQTV
jgi:hypothetical protein